MVRPLSARFSKLENKGNGRVSLENINLSRALKFALISVVLLITSSVSAQNKVVVIPMAGDARPLQNIVTVAKKFGDFDDPIEAVNSITDACVNGPYLVVIAPGVYTLSGQLLMKDCVNISGSGKDLTLLTGTVSGGSPTAVSALVVGADSTELSDLTIANSDGVSQNSIGLYNSDVSMTVYRSRIEVSNAEQSYGVFNDNAAITRLIDCDVSVTGGTNFQTGVSSFDSSSLILHNTTISISGGSSVQVGVSSSSLSHAIIRDSTILVTDGPAADIGVNNLASTTYARIRDSYIQGASSPINASTGSGAIETYVSDTIVNGGLVLGTPKCNFVFEDDGTPLDSDCDPPP